MNLRTRRGPRRILPIWWACATRREFPWSMSGMTPPRCASSQRIVLLQAAGDALAGSRCCRADHSDADRARRVAAALRRFHARAGGDPRDVTSSEHLSVWAQARAPWNRAGAPCNWKTRGEAQAAMASRSLKGRALILRMVDHSSIFRCWPGRGGHRDLFPFASALLRKRFLDDGPQRLVFCQRGYIGRSAGMSGIGREASAGDAYLCMSGE